MDPYYTAQNRPFSSLLSPTPWTTDVLLWPNLKYPLSTLWHIRSFNPCIGSQKLPYMPSQIPPLPSSQQKMQPPCQLSLNLTSLLTAYTEKPHKQRHWKWGNSYTINTIPESGSNLLQPNVTWDLRNFPLLNTYLQFDKAPVSLNVVVFSILIHPSYIYFKTAINFSPTLKILVVTVVTGFKERMCIPWWWYE